MLRFYSIHSYSWLEYLKSVTEFFKPYINFMFSIWSKLHRTKRKKINDVNFKTTYIIYIDRDLFWKSNSVGGYLAEKHLVMPVHLSSH
jgi:hypothetical protein